MTAAYIFVAVGYLILGAAFVASSGLVVYEFRDVDWLSVVITHSHLFFFYPVFALLALAAFYVPSVVFTDLYWRHLRYGKLRFLVGMLVLAAASYWVAKWLDAKPRALWEVSPGVLAADRGEPQGCGGSGGPVCLRAPMLATLQDLRQEGQRRLGLSKFARSCAIDPMLEAPDEMVRDRYCFPARARLKGSECCEVQKRFADEVARLQADPRQRSLSGTYDAIFMPLKTFFVLIVIAIGVLLSGWRNQIDQLYRPMVPAI